MEARAALSHPGISNVTSNQSPVKVDVAPAPVTSVGGQSGPTISSGMLTSIWMHVHHLLSIIYIFLFLILP